MSEEVKNDGKKNENSVKPTQANQAGAIIVVKAHLAGILILRYSTGLACLSCDSKLFLTAGLQSWDLGNAG